MKQKLLIFFLLVAGNAAELIIAQTLMDQMAIEIIPQDYGNPSEITSFIEGQRPYTNSATTWLSVSSEFRGYQFLSTNSNNIYTGQIVPSSSGEIYLVASGTLSISGWTKTNYVASYKLSNTPTTLYVFKRSVQLGDTVNIPTNANWAGLSPLARSIKLKEIDPNTLSLVRTSPAENEVCYSNLQKEIKLYFNNEVESGDGKLFLNGSVIPLKACRFEEEDRVVSIPVSLEASSLANKSYTFTATAGCFKEKISTKPSSAISLNFKTSKIAEYPSTYSAQLDVVYKNIDSSNTRMDVYYPKNSTKPVPIIIRFHGGGWKSGLKEDYTNFSLYFNQGYALANVEYRLTAEAKAPAAVEDARAAIIYILRHAEEFNIDRKKIILLGGSAGGHIALTAGYLQDNRIYDNDIEPYEDEVKVMAVVDKYGITKLSDLMSYSSLVEWLGPNVNDEEFVCSLSPVDLIGSNTPPTYIVHGDADITIPYGQSVLLQKTLQAHGVENKFTTIVGGGHGGFSSGENKMIDNEVIQFINKIVEEYETSSITYPTNEDQTMFVVRNGKITILNREVTDVALYDVTGELMSDSLDIKASGLYILKMRINDTIIAQKFIAHTH